MPSVAVNAPKTPVTKGSSGIAAATLPNICKMPGPPAPFVPTPLPNIGKSDNSPEGYSTTVTIEGNPVAIKGATFDSMGDVASQGTGGGLISSNVQGPTKFIGPGSMDVKIEGNNVQLLGDPMLNNCGPGGSPANAATMGGVLQAPLPPGEPPAEDPKCKKIADEIEKIINSVREPTPKGSFPQGFQGLAKRWEEIAKNIGNWSPGRKLDNHLIEFRKTQKLLKDQLEKWDKNGCDDKGGPPLPQRARAYSNQEPVPGGPTVPEVAPTPSAPAAPAEASVTGADAAKAAGTVGTVVVVLIVVSRIIRLFPPLLPLELSPI
jgi:uncharacterized Zn-binding protein involved in type VI secretion